MTRESHRSRFYSGHTADVQAVPGPSRQQRRRFDRQLPKLMTDNCSYCNGAFPHNSRTFGGYDQRGRLAYVGECCRNQLAIVRISGFYSQRHYDFLDQRSSGSKPGKQRPGHVNSMEEADAAIAAYRNVIADADRYMDATARQGGITSLPPQAQFNMGDAPWKEADRLWFEQNPDRSHRARLPLPGELDVEAAKAPEGHAMILLIRQVEPGTRIKAGFFLNAGLLPVPDDEAVCHAMFDVATKRVPIPPGGAAREALIERYVLPERTQ